MNPKAYLLTEDDLLMLSEKANIPIDELLNEVTSSGSKDRVARALDILDLFFDKPLMFTGSKDPENLIWHCINLVENLAHAARGFGFITFCCYREAMGARGPHKLAKGKSYEEIVVALKEVYDRYLPWFWNHLYYFSFETEYTEDDNPSDLRCKSIERLHAFILKEARKHKCPVEIEENLILYSGPFWRGGKPPKRLRIYVMKQKPTGKPATYRVFKPTAQAKGSEPTKRIT